MSLKQKYALGESVPNNPHAVVSNVPTLEDVCAYEEKADYVVSGMKQGYPRFVQHAWVNQLIMSVVKSFALEVSYAVLLQKNQQLESFFNSLGEGVRCLPLSEATVGVPMDLIYINASDGDKTSLIRAFEIIYSTYGLFDQFSYGRKGSQSFSELKTVGAEIDASMIEHARYEAQDRLAKLELGGVNGIGSADFLGNECFLQCLQSDAGNSTARGRSQRLQLG